ncbi:mechanosensitive ion channel protein [Sphingobium sp. Leaf26]|nr:mechanosensitive ion channel protein [Sphingobium sp. Leaf26]
MALILLVLSIGLAGPVRAQVDSALDPAARLAQAEKDVRSVDQSLDTRMDASDRKLLLAKALAAKTTASDAAGDLQDQLALLDAKLTGLGAVAAGSSEAPDIKRQRAALARQRSAIDSAIKRGNLIGVEAQQLADEIERSEAEQFSQKISTRSPSPLSPGFWSALGHAFPRDLRRAEAFMEVGRTQVAEALRDHRPWHALTGLLLALLIVGPGQVAARHMGQRMLTEGVPGRRVRRSSYALCRVAVGTFAPLLAALSIAQGLRWSGLVADRWEPLLGAFVGGCAFSGFTFSVIGALLMRSRPSWRIAAISDNGATKLRPYSLLLALLTFLGVIYAQFNASVGVGKAAQEATQAVFALLHILLVSAVLVTVAHLRAAKEENEEGSRQESVSGLISLLAWIVVTVATIGLLLGYFSLSLFLLQMISWATVLGSAVYLLMAAIDDLATTIFDRSSRFGMTLVRSLGLRGSAVEQFGVLLSALLRLAVLLLGFSMLLSPFGAGNVASLFSRLGTLAQGFEVGGVAISPGAILRGILVLLIGLALVRGFMRWLERRYLPVTDLDGSGRNSVSLVARYVGIALAVIWGLASLGIGMERIAILLSALSVGIGFGLQAITQNFVSGLILLAERPIKIGDLVRVGQDEGDVKRISVRSTEIQLPDHSTLIVPNSELITKTVLNKTLASPLGRMQIQFSVPIETDADKVRAIVLATFADEPAVLAEPAYTVFIDSIADGRIFFNSFAHVASPRAAYSARSNVLTVVLRRLREEGIEIGTVPQRMELITTASEK